MAGLGSIICFPVREPAAQDQEFISGIYKAGLVEWWTTHDFVISF